MAELTKTGDMIIKQAKTRPTALPSVLVMTGLLLLGPLSKAGAKYWQIGGGPWLLSIMPTEKLNPTLIPTPTLLYQGGRAHHDDEKELSSRWSVDDLQIFHKLDTRCVGISAKLSDLDDGNQSKIQQLGCIMFNALQHQNQFQKHRRSLRDFFYIWLHHKRFSLCSIMFWSSNVLKVDFRAPQIHLKISCLTSLKRSYCLISISYDHHQLDSQPYSLCTSIQVPCSLELYLILIQNHIHRVQAFGCLGH